MKTQHTPAPWNFVKASRDTYEITAHNGASLVAKVVNLEYTKANAKLLAAAPELLEVLQRLRIDLNSNMIETARKRIEEAIKKATE